MELTWRERRGEGWFYKGRGKEDETVDLRIRGQFLMPVSLGIREKHEADFVFFFTRVVFDFKFQPNFSKFSLTLHFLLIIF